MDKWTQWKASGKPFYISITGLQPRSIWKILPFFRHAIPSRSQALKAPGALFVDVRQVNGVHHTLSAWESREHMKKYIYQGAHLKAIQAFRIIATGKTFGYMGTELPSWDELHERWQKEGKEY